MKAFTPSPTSQPVPMGAGTRNAGPGNSGHQPSPPEHCPGYARVLYYRYSPLSASSSRACADEATATAAAIPHPQR